MMKTVKEVLMTNVRTKIGALLIKPALKKALAHFDTDSHGGAPLLGLNGLVVKSHGNSKAVVIRNCIEQCVKFKEQKINEKIKEGLALVSE